MLLTETVSMTHNMTSTKPDTMHVKETGNKTPIKTYNNTFGKIRYIRTKIVFCLIIINILLFSLHQGINERMKM